MMHERAESEASASTSEWVSVTTVSRLGFRQCRLFNEVESRDESDNVDVGGGGMSGGFGPASQRSCRGFVSRCRAGVGCYYCVVLCYVLCALCNVNDVRIEGGNATTLVSVPASTSGRWQGLWLRRPTWRSREPG